MRKIMFDTNAIDKLKENWNAIISTQNDVEYWITQEVWAQLKAIPDRKKDKREDNLFRIFELVEEPISTPFIIGHSKIGSAHLANDRESELYDFFIKDRKDIYDALICVSAIINDCTLVSNDKKVQKRMIEGGFDCISSDAFFNTLNLSKHNE